MPSTPWYPRGWSRRDFLKYLSLAALAACGGQAGTTTTGAPGTTAAPGTTGPSTGVGAPEELFEEPRSSLSGDLRILLWSHFVPAHDEWFDPFARAWGEQVGVNVTIDHINVADIPGRIASEISAGEGHDLIQYIATLSQFEPSCHPLNDVTAEAESRWGSQLEVCRLSSYNPNTDTFYAFSPGWSPDPGDYRRSLWEQAGFPNGPASWDDLLQGGSQIFGDQGVQMGIGMSQEIDSNMAGRALLWSYGASIQDENENVTLASDQTLAAIEYMTQLYEGAMTDEVFAWNAASNNQGLIAGELSYILNSISAWRTAQEANPDVAEDIYFVKALEGPEAALAAQHVLYNWIVPSFSQNVDAAQEFLLHYTLNHEAVTWHSKLYDFPAFSERVPRLNEWLDDDPFGGGDRLQVLKDSTEWSVNVGYPGPASPAIGEVFGTFVIPNMFAAAARGEKSPEQAMEDAHAEAEAIFEGWREEGLVGGSSA